MRERREIRNLGDLDGAIGGSGTIAVIIEIAAILVADFGITVVTD